jgi:nicotinate-nucleotide adenylyltransferase
MLRLGLDSQWGIEPSALSLERQGISYAYQTVEQVRGLYPNAELWFLMGPDMLASFASWKEPERILSQCALAVFCRGDKGEQESIAQAVAELKPMGAKIALLDNPVTAISSTQLRRMLVMQCAGEFLPPAVLDYIRANGLYGTGKDYRGLSLEELEKTVVSLLKPNRVQHVLGCRQAAVELARLYGADETDAARAALLHDITKSLDGPLQLTLCREYGTILDTFSSHNPKTLHALTGSLVAERIFGENAAVVEAIRSHTTGKADMNLLQKIIYVADYMEPNRDFPGVERLRELAFSDLDEALKMGLMMTLDHLANLGDEVSPESRQALEYLNVKV